MPFIIPIFLCITPIRKFNFNLTPHFPIKNLFRRKHSIKHYSSFSLPYFTRNFNFIIPTYLRFPIKKTSFRSFQLLQFTNNFIPLPGESHQNLAPIKMVQFQFHSRSIPPKIESPPLGEATHVPRTTNKISISPFQFRRTDKNIRTRLSPPPPRIAVISISPRFPKITPHHNHNNHHHHHDDDDSDKHVATP